MLYHYRLVFSRTFNTQNHREYTGFFGGGGVFVCFLVRLHSISINTLKFTYVLEYNNSFIFVTEQYFIDIFIIMNGSCIYLLMDIWIFFFFQFLAITSKTAMNIYVHVFVCIYISIYLLINRQLNSNWGPLKMPGALCALSHHWYSVLISFFLTQGSFWVHLCSLSLCHSLKTIKEVSWGNHKTHLFCFLNKRISDQW